jgi:hypothetical protein
LRASAQQHVVAVILDHQQALGAFAGSPREDDQAADAAVSDQEITATTNHCHGQVLVPRPRDGSDEIVW